MASDYERICSDNLVEYGKGTRHLSFLERLYSERTHFIFELLQNAEDARATRVRFVLTANRLTVWHDGRPFDERDVRGVCGIAEGTKEDDLTQIGKFGIGFKSVYAFTVQPEIHCGAEHFAIEKYIRPRAVSPISVPQPWTTLFVLPFNRIDVAPATAGTEILECLQTLNARTMLFLRRVRRIEWASDNGPTSYLERGEVASGSARRVTVTGKVGDGSDSGAWLVFESAVTSEASVGPLRVEAAFRLVRDADSGRDAIAPAGAAALSVFFPTEKPTGLGFLVQGPYRTTPARDNVPKDDAWNRKLVLETAELVVASLRHLRDMGLLSVGALQTMPVRQADFLPGSMFRPIFDAVATALKAEALLPTDSGGFAGAADAKLSRASELRKLFPAETLTSLLGGAARLQWVSAEITEVRTPDLYAYCRQILQIEEIAPENIVRQLTRLFLEKTSDAWLGDLYEFLAGQEALWRKPRWAGDPPGPVRATPIIRLDDGVHVVPFKPDGTPAAYLNAPAEADGVPLVRRAIWSRDPCRNFLEKLGLGQFDLVAMLKTFIFSKYGAKCSIGPEENVEHVRIIQRVLRELKDPVRATILTDISAAEMIFADSAGANHSQYLRPGHVYFRDDELLMYFKGNSNAWLLSSRYPEDLTEVLEEIGVSHTIRVQRRDRRRDWQGYIRLDGYPYRRGANGFDPAVDVDGLTYAVANPNIERSRYIWNNIASPNAHDVRGIIEESSRTDFRYVTPSMLFSTMGKVLANAAWLPQGTRFRKPAEITLDDLPADFERAQALAGQLGMKVNEVAVLAQKIGVEIEALTIAQQIAGDKELFAKFQQLIAAKQSKPEFPTRSVPNPARRTDRVTEEFEAAPKKEYEVKSRSVRTSEPAQDARTWLREAYTNSSEQMVCQLCEEVMPFKDRHGEYYFEAVECLDRLRHEHQALYLALCPLCAAKYKEFVKRDPVAVDAFRGAAMAATGSEIALRLGTEDWTLRFVDSHFLDLQTILRATELDTASVAADTSS